MDRMRRPTGTPTLGVPDLAWATARAAAATALIGNTKWVTIAPITLTGGVLQIAASIPMVATSTGRFRTRLTGYIANAAGGAINTIASSDSTGAGSIVPNYGGSALTVSANPTESILNLATVAQIIDLPTAGFTAAPGSTTIVNALLESGGAGLSVLAGAMQFEVEEY